MTARFSRWLLRYYTAVRLSAGAAMLYLPFETPNPRAPIVREADTDGPSGFDRREVVIVAGRVSVVTLPLASQQPSVQLPYGLN